jgi:hypothetical protein
MSDETPSEPKPRSGCDVDCFCLGLGPELTSLLRKLAAPDDVRRQLHHAELEILRAVKALVDMRLQQVDAPSSKGTRVPVD